MEATELSAKEARETLTARDLEVVAMTAKGMERLEIAESLDVSLSGINRHLTKALRLTGAKNGTHLVALLIGDGRLPLAGVRIRAERIVHEAMVNEPSGETEEHMNNVLLDVARQMGARL